jgi:hypothetical protein
MSAFVGWFTECKNTMDCLSNMRGRQCMCNVTMRCVRATIVAVEKQWVLHILSVCFFSLSYPARNTHAPYCHLWPAPLWNILSHYLINGKIFLKKKKNLDINCVFWFYLQPFSQIFFIIRRTEQCIIKNVYRSLCKVPFIPFRF